MKTYAIYLKLKVEVDAPDLQDAEDAVADCFGVGDFAGVNIVESRVLDAESI